MKKLHILFLFIAILFFSGCIIEYREGLPAEIVISEMPEPELESMECQNPPCATLVQMSEVKRTEYVCSPSYKEANNDPQGAIYKTQLGDYCNVIDPPTTVCIKYNCDFNEEEQIGYYQITMKYSFSGWDWYNGQFKKRSFSNYSDGVALISENPMGSLNKRFNGGSLGSYEKSDGVIYDFKKGLRNGGFITFADIGFLKDGSTFYKHHPTLVSASAVRCPAEMPMIYPYNAINFEYSPILDVSTENPELLNNLETDYILLKDFTNDFLGKESVREDPCDPICTTADEALLESGVESSKQYEEECNQCQEEQKEILKENTKTSKSDGLGVGGFTAGDLNVKDDGTTICTGMNPCVEIDRAYAEGDGEPETKYFICQCACDAVIYSGWSCSRAGDNTEYFYTSCEIQEIESDQGGFIFSVHGFEAELFKNVLADSQNKMPTFMLGQGPDFESYSAAKDVCVPETTADVIIEAGNKPFLPEAIEVIKGNPICFRNDGMYPRDISFGETFNIDAADYLITLNSSESICFSTGEDTNFTEGIYYIFVNDNEVYATLNVIEPSTSIVSNSIKENDNGELKFFYNDEIELSLLYASAPILSYLIDPEENKYYSYSTGEFTYPIDISYSGLNRSATWISYETNYNSMSLIEHNLYDSKYDLNNDGYIDITDLVLCSQQTSTCSVIEMKKKYVYFDNLIKENTNFDYPTIKRNSNYFEYSPSAIVLPLYSDFCIHNTINKKVDLILEKKTNPIYSRLQNPFIIPIHPLGPIPSLKYDGQNVGFIMRYMDGVLSDFFKPLKENTNGFDLVVLNSINYNANYQFVDGKSLYQGMECCFNLGEPGVYRVSSLTGETGAGYVVVFPNDVGNTFVLNDYEYVPSYATPLDGDFVCIENTYDFDRTLELSGSKTGTIELKKSTETCSYDWASKTGDTILFKDKTTGGEFELEVTDSDILNIEVVGSMFIQKTGKISKEGTICLISKDETNSDINIYSLSSTGKSFVQNIKLSGNTMECFSKILSDGLYEITIEITEESFVIPVMNSYYLVIGEENTGYIYNSTFYGSPLVFEMEDYESLLSSEITLRPSREIIIYSLDNLEYYLYSKIDFDNKMGFYTPSYSIKTPNIVFENRGNETMFINILNSKEERPTISVKPKEFSIYNYKEGDTQIELDGIFYPMSNDYKKLDVDLEDMFEPRKKALIDGSKIIIAKNDDYYVNNVLIEKFNYESIKFTTSLKFDVSSSITQSVYFGLNVESGTTQINLPGSLINIPIKLFDSPILDSFVIDAKVDKKSEIEMQKISGTMENLDFAVQVLNDVPTYDMLLSAKEILAYDKSLPVFMYSRLGDVEVGIENPSKTQYEYIPKGAEVYFILSDWVVQNADIASSKSVGYGFGDSNILNEDITFTIKTDSGVEKKLEVKAVDPATKIVMNYEEFKVDGDLSSKQSKIYYINNLAYEPRAFTLRANDADDYCIMFEGVQTKKVNLTSAIYKSASKMKLYDVSASAGNLVLHDDLYGELIKEISDITILPNYGVEVSGITLKRLSAGGEAGDEETGYLYIEPTITSNPNEVENVLFNEGAISGLDNTNYVRAYRFYGDSAKLKINNIDSTVYGSDTDNYSIIARAFTLDNSPPISTLLGITNTYLRAKDVKAVPNKWYMAGLANTEFSKLVQGYDTYLRETFGSTTNRTIANKKGEYANWTSTGCGDYIFVVPFNNTHIPLTFAYDVPVTSTSSPTLKGKADYLYTSYQNYEAVLHRVNSNIPFTLYNGEMLNDIRILLSENPNIADEICGYYYTKTSFTTIYEKDDQGFYADNYDKIDKYVLEFYKDDNTAGIISNPCLSSYNTNEKHDFELDIHSGKLRNEIGTNGEEMNPIMIYTPTGTFCGWGGVSGYYSEDRFCDGTKGDITGSNLNNVCLGNIGSCSSGDKDCLKFHIGTKEDLWEINRDYCNVEYDECVAGCSGPYAASCSAICLTTLRFCVDNVILSEETNLDRCYDSILSNIEYYYDDTDYYRKNLNDYLKEPSICSASSVGVPINKYLLSKINSLTNCLDAVDAGIVKCDEGLYWNSIDADIDKFWDMKTWWCRSNIDTFGHETQMFCSGKDCWNYFNVIKTDSIPIKDKFDNGLSYNDNIYHFISGGYFDIFAIDDKKQGDNDKVLDICLDRGKDDSKLSDFYQNTSLSYDKGLTEDAFTYGLFFMLNSVDTGDYFFNSEVNEDNYYESSKGYALSSVFYVENNKGRKLLCVGADTFNGIDIVLGPGGKESFTLDLNTNYNVYEPAYFTNFKLKDDDDDERYFSHVSLFAHDPISDYILGSFKHLKPMLEPFINPKVDYGNSIPINIYLYNLTTQLKYDDGTLSNFDVIEIINGEKLILENIGETDVVWYYAPDDICEKGFTKLLNDRYAEECAPKGANEGNYMECIKNPTKYSVNPSDIIDYLNSKDIPYVSVEGASEVEIEDLTVPNSEEYNEYLFFNPQTGKRFKVIVSKQEFVVNIDINTFKQDSVNVLNNPNSRLCLRNYDLLSKEIILTSKIDSSETKIYQVDGYGEYCFSYIDLINNYVSDSTLGRRLNVDLETFSESSDSVSNVIKEITKKVTENNMASFNPAYRFFELNFGASATPSIITTELVDYKIIDQYMSYDCTPTPLNPCFNQVGDVGGAVANQVYEIVSNSKIEITQLCEEDINEINEGTICSEVDEEEGDKQAKINEMFDLTSINCNDKKKYPSEEDTKKCEDTKMKVLDKIEEIQDELNPYTIINEDKVITMLPILIQFNNGKTELSNEEIQNIKDFIDKVNENVNSLCDEYGDCNNSVNVNTCDESKIKIENRYLDMIGFIILIDDPGPSKTGNCSFMYNYLEGIMNISSYAASTNLTTGKLGTPSMVLGFGVNRKTNVLESCWSDLEFKSEIEALFKTDFMIMLDKGIIGFGHYCLRDGECKPISTNIQGEDYGLYRSLQIDGGWSSFIPIEIPGIETPEFEKLPEGDKENCLVIKGIYYCDPVIDADSIKTQQSGFSLTESVLNNINLGSVNTGGSMGSISNTGLSSTIAGNLGGLLGSTFSGITLNPEGDLVEIPPLVIYPGLLSNGMKKEPMGKEWFDRCGRYYYNGEGMTMVVYPEMVVPEGQQGKSCNPGRVMEIYKKFNC